MKSAHCVARNKPIRREITKPQLITVAVCGFEVCLSILNFIVIGQYTVNIPAFFQVFSVFWVWQYKETGYTCISDNRNKRKFGSFPLQIVAFVSVKVRGTFKRTLPVKYVQSLDDGIFCSGGSSPYFYDQKLVMSLKIQTFPMTSKCKLVLGFRAYCKATLVWLARHVSINIHCFRAIPFEHSFRNLLKISVQIIPISEPESFSNALS